MNALHSYPWLTWTWLLAIAARIQLGNHLGILEIIEGICRSNFTNIDEVSLINFSSFQEALSSFHREWPFYSLKYYIFSLQNEMNVFYIFSKCSSSIGQVMDSWSFQLILSLFIRSSLRSTHILRPISPIVRSTTGPIDFSKTGLFVIVWFFIFFSY